MTKKLRVLGALVGLVGILVGCSSSNPEMTTSTGGEKAGSKKLVIGVLPKLVGIPYFNEMEKGAKEAGSELGVEVVYDGPVTADSSKQVAIIESWIARKMDAIIVSPNDPDAIAPVLKKARSKGIKVITTDADSKVEDREFFVSQASNEGIAKALVDSMAKGIGPKGKFIILTGSLSAANQNAWMAEMEKYRAAAYPEMVNLSPTPKTSEEDQALATQVTLDLLKAYPDVKGIYAITSAALPGAAEGLKKANAGSKVFLTGLATPNAMKEFINENVLKEFVLWSPADLGYLAVQVAKGSVDGTLTTTTSEFKAGRLGTKSVKDGVVLLGEPLVFSKENIAKFDF